MSDVRIAVLDTGSLEVPVGGQATYCRAVLPHVVGDVVFWGAMKHQEFPADCVSPQHAVVHPIVCRSLMKPRRPGRRPWLPDRLVCLLGVVRMRKEILRSCDVVYVQSPELALPLVYGPGRKPVLLHMHGAGGPLAHSRYAIGRAKVVQVMYGWIQEAAITRVARVLSVDSAGVTRARMLRCGTGDPDVVLVPSCFDAGHFHRGARVIEDSEDRQVTQTQEVLFVGRLEEGKGVQNLLMALGTWPPSGARVHVSIAGDGSYRSQLEVLASGVPATVQIDFLGWLSPESIAERMLSADLTVLPSSQEGLPISILESLACGTPVLACRTGDVGRVVIDQVNGILLEDNAPGSLLLGLQAALGHSWSAPTISASVTAYSCHAVGEALNRELMETVSMALHGPSPDLPADVGA